MTDSALFRSAAIDLLGPRGFTTDPELVNPWLTDWRGRYTGAARGLASPATTAQVSQFVQLCAEHHVPIVPQGGNSGIHRSVEVRKRPVLSLPSTVRTYV